MLKKGSVFRWLTGIIILLGLSACKIDMEQEIWLKKDESGKVSLKIDMQIPVGIDNVTPELKQLYSVNAFYPLAEIAEKTPGIVITELSQRENHSDKDTHFTYWMNFTFENMEGLNKVLSAKGKNAISLVKEGKNRILSIETDDLALLESEDIDYSWFELLEINFHNKIHLPAKIKKIDDGGYGKCTSKTATWNIAFDDDWLSSKSHLLYVIY